MSEKLPEPVDEPPEIQRVWEIIESGNKGRQGSREALLKLLDEHPGIEGVFGDQALVAEDRLLSLTTGKNIVCREFTRRFSATMRRRLAQPGDGELERLVIDRVVLSWHSLCFVERRRAERCCESITQAEVAYWDRRISSLQGDFLKACRALGDLRRLARPTVLAQMNIADKQQIYISAGGQPVEGEHAGSAGDPQ